MAQVGDGDVRAWNPLEEFVRAWVARIEVKLGQISPDVVRDSSGFYITVERLYVLSFTQEPPMLSDAAHGIIPDKILKVVWNNVLKHENHPLYLFDGTREAHPEVTRFKTKAKQWPDANIWVCVLGSHVMKRNGSHPR